MTYCNESITVAAGKTATLHCHVSGTPRPRVVWRTRGGRLARVDKISDNIYNIQETRIEDSGEYNCTATNGFGKEDSCSIFLIVIGMILTTILTQWTI